MSLKKTILFDLNLLSGSSELLRNAFGAHYYNNGGIAFGNFEEPEILEIEATNSDLVNVNEEGFLPNLSFPVRIKANIDGPISDEDWRAYLIGGKFSDKEYTGIYSINVYADHAVNEDYLPYKPSEVERNSTGLSPSIVLTTEYFQNYSRYQSYTNALESELMIPNLYELNDRPLFAVVRDTSSYPQHTYPNIKNYLNDTFVNDETILDEKNRNIFILNAIDIKNSEKHDNLQSDSSYIKSEEDLSKKYSLMPFANKLEIDKNLTDFQTRKDFRNIIEEKKYQYKFLKLLKETFQNEISLTPSTVNFGLSVDSYSIDYEAGTSTQISSSQSIPLRLVDVPTMLLYGFRNPVPETTDVNTINSSSYTTHIEPFEDTSGAYRHIASDRSLDILNSFKDIINTNFDTTSLDSLDELFSKAKNSKYHETMAFRIQKIGGPPTGDSRTENTIQNIWFYNTNEAIRYIDTQVKYDTEYTYKVFSYVLLQGYKYQTTGLVATRKIAEEGHTNCLEFYDPYTGQTSPQLAGEENFSQISDDLQNELDKYQQLMDNLPSIETLFTNFIESLSDSEVSFLKDKEIYLDFRSYAPGSGAGAIHNYPPTEIQPNVSDRQIQLQEKLSKIRTEIEYLSGPRGAIKEVNQKLENFTILDSETLIESASDYRLGSSQFERPEILLGPRGGILSGRPVVEVPSYLRTEQTISSTPNKIKQYLKRSLEALQIIESTLEDSHYNSINKVASRIESYEDGMNILATNSQVRTLHRYLADLKVTIEPSVKIVEIPLEEKTMRIVDHPPNDFNVSPYHLQDQSNRLAFYLKYDTFSVDTEPYPTTLSPTDERNAISYKEGKDFVPGSLTKEESVSAARFIEVYRTTEKPTSYQSFVNNLRTTIDLKTMAGDIASDHFFMERVRENTKYYYTFRAVNENGVAGQLSPIFESELINDGGYVYGLFNQLSEDELVEPPPKSPTLSIKNLLNVVPNIQHLQLDTSDADFTKNSVSEKSNIKLGDGSTDFWNQKFKIRLTSKKTGRKLDINLTFERK
jgi:hypothetical protein